MLRTWAGCAVVCALSFGLGWVAESAFGPPQQLSSDAEAHIQLTATRAGVPQTRTERPDMKAQLASQRTQLPSLGEPGYVQELERLAPGNAYAAYELSELVRRCSFLERISVEDIDAIAATRAARAMAAEEAVAEQIENDHGVSLPTSSFSEGVDRAEREAAQLARTRSHCSSVAANGKSAFELLQQAASLGHPASQLGYWRAALYGRADISAYPERKTLAIRFLSEALGRGEPQALLALAQIHREGLVGPPDPVLAHAFLVAYSKAPQHGFLEQALATASVMRHASEAGISQGDLALARALGAEIVERCCS